MLWVVRGLVYGEKTNIWRIRYNRRLYDMVDLMAGDQFYQRTKITMGRAYYNGNRRGREPSLGGKDLAVDPDKCGSMFMKKIDQWRIQGLPRLAVFLKDHFYHNRLCYIIMAYAVNCHIFIG